MDVFAGRAFEGPNVEAQGSGGDAGQVGSFSARGAKWSEDDHDALKFHRCSVLLT